MIDLETIYGAHRRIAPRIRRTEVVRCEPVDRMLGASVCFKCENLQEAGSFKSRGACNVVFSLSEAAAARGVVTHSSGNHAAALARAARLRSIAAHIVMPRTARPVKIANVERFGGRITICEPTLAARQETADRIIRRTGAILVHPYDDWGIIAGQATAAIELLEEVPDLQLIVVPVGGGGLLAGTALAAKCLRKSIEVWGAEPAGADDAYRSWCSGTRVPSTNPQTIADGLLTSLGVRNFEVIRRKVDRIVLADEPAIREATELLNKQLGMPIEPSAAVPLAALRQHRSVWRHERVGIILSGGNIAPETPA